MGNTCYGARTDVCASTETCVCIYMCIYIYVCIVEIRVCVSMSLTRCTIYSTGIGVHCTIRTRGSLVEPNGSGESVAPISVRSVVQDGERFSSTSHAGESCMMWQVFTGLPDYSPRSCGRGGGERGVAGGVETRAPRVCFPPRV